MKRPSRRQMLRAVAIAPAADLWTVVRALSLAPFVEFGLRSVGLRRTAGALQVRLRFEGPPGAVAPAYSDLPLTLAERHQLQIAWRAMTVGPFDSTCLRRALVGARLLRRREHAVRIGVRRTPDGRIKAHAWLEVDGVSLDPDAPDDFAAQWHPPGAP